MDDPRPSGAARATAKACNPRELAGRRKRQTVVGSLVAFGATVALVLSHPITSDAAGSASTTTDAAGGAAPVAAAQAPATTTRPAAPGTSPQRGTPQGQPAQPAPTFFAPSQGQGGAAPAPQLRTGGGRRGAVGSGGS